MKEKASQSQLFRPYRAVGFVCDHIPFDLQYFGRESFITTSIGHNYHIYNVCLQFSHFLIYSTNFNN